MNTTPSLLTTCIWIIVEISMFSTIHMLGETWFCMKISMTATPNHTQDQIILSFINLVIQNIQGSIRECFKITEQIICTEGNKCIKGHMMHSMNIASKINQWIKGALKEEPMREIGTFCTEESKNHFDLMRLDGQQIHHQIYLKNLKDMICLAIKSYLVKKIIIHILYLNLNLGIFIYFYTELFFNRRSILSKMATTIEPF